MSVDSTPVETTAEQSFQDYKASRLADKQPVEEAKEPEVVPDSSEGSEEQPETPVESETTEKQETEGEEKPEKKGGFQRRIDKLTREKRELEAKLGELEGKLADKPAVQPKEEPKPTPEGKPSIEKYETYDEYVEALAEWKIDQREKARVAEESKRKAEAEQQARNATWQERVAEFSKQYDDFDEVLESIKVPITPAVQNTILESENGPALAYWLAQHGDELKRISGLSDLAAAREIGKIEASLTQPKPAVQAKPKVSAAPAPIKPVGGTASAHKKPLTEVPYEEYKKRRLAGER